MSTFTQKHYVAIAETIRDAMDSTERSVVVASLAERFARRFAADNDKFDRARFLKACGLPEEKGK